ncbi:MAG: serine--tRNA ligase [Candidatus Saccharibacteria bacterium]|nr:serine--tRNA ligase [Candidatus Saccharibacteria bacterium]
MIDVQFIRENPDLVQEKSAQKGYPVDVKQLLGFDEKRRDLIQEVEEVRRQRNELAENTKGQKPSDEQIAAGKTLKEKSADLEHKLASIDKEYHELLKQVPNMPLDDVPVGESEEQNQVVKTWGDKPEFDFQPKSHWELGEQRGWIDKERAAKVAGSRFAYLAGDLVLLEFAIIQFVLSQLTDKEVLEKIIADNELAVQPTPFTPILPPYLINTDMYDAMDRLEPRDDRYKIEGEELWLQGSAEHTIGSMFADEILREEDGPVRRYLGFATSFRKEAGTYGKDTEGIIRMHQFDKLEMESFTLAAHGLNEHKFFIAIQEYLVQRLGLPYQLVQKCTADIGKPNARGVDIDTWMPGQGKYRETHTADYMTDYQARRLKTRFKREDGELEFAHTNDATAFALGRIMVAIIENNQTDDGKLVVPEVLRPYMNGAEII